LRKRELILIVLLLTLCEVITVKTVETIQVHRLNELGLKVTKAQTCRDERGHKTQCNNTLENFRRDF
jgi:hypothetical protein